MTDARTHDYVLVDEGHEILVTDDEVEALWKKDDKSLWRSEDGPTLYMVTSGGARLEWTDSGWVAIFRPGAPTAGNALSTWTEVSDVIHDSTGSVVIYIDDSIAPAIADTNLNCADKKVTIAAKPAPAPLVRLVCQATTFVLGPKAVLSFAGNIEINGGVFEERLLANVEVP